MHILKYNKKHQKVIKERKKNRSVFWAGYFDTDLPIGLELKNF